MPSINEWRQSAKLVSKGKLPHMIKALQTINGWKLFKDSFPYMTDLRIILENELSNKNKERRE